MPRTAAEEARLARFAKEYERSQDETELAIERAVCGCDYGGTSWATRQEVESIVRMLGLSPGKRLLELGAGAGWPGLYMAGLAGCEVALVDVPLSGLKIAARRAVADQMSGASWAVAADGCALPLQRAAFDAINHSDVLCCLKAKASVLTECRRVMRDTGIMAFTVIAVAPGLSAAAYRRAVESGPIGVETEEGYPALLMQTGWAITQQVDLTPTYVRSAHRMLQEEEARAEALTRLLGAADYADLIERRRRTVRAVDDGLQRRELIVARPASP
jgi:ubiquinone/menaquinone biosynthesis C-methylase UbiE